ncbi:MAG TPA: PEP-CTERM sorting domain-containing protein [Chthoniobacter sp.]|nr:PEP-CTERM sorting domain-containing protein [Chthoniobacter sp.]
MRVARPFLSAVAIVALVPSFASAATFTLSPTQDTFVSSANSTSNYGAAGALLVNAAGLPKGEFDSLLQFNFSSAKSSFDLTFGVGQWSIQSVTLQLTSANPGNPIFNSPAAAGAFTLNWMQDDSWTEGNGTPMAASTNGGVTYATLPGFRSGADQSLGTYNFPGGTSGNNIYTLGLNGSFVADATAGNAVSLLALPADSAIVYTANSQNFTTPASRPVLTVTAVGVPEPGTAVLLLAGMSVGMLFRRRRRSA